MRVFTRSQRNTDDCGGAAVEYLLLVTFITAAVLSSLTVFGTGIQTMYLESCNQIARAVQPGSSC